MLFIESGAALCTELNTHPVWRETLHVPDVGARRKRRRRHRVHLVFALRRALHSALQPRRIGGESRRRGAIMPGHLQDGFGCVVTNRFDQLLDDESDPFDILKAAENRRKDAAAAAAKPAAQAARQPKKESQKERKNPPPERKEDPQPAAPLKKDGMAQKPVSLVHTIPSHCGF